MINGIELSIGILLLFFDFKCWNILLRIIVLLCLVNICVFSFCLLIVIMVLFELELLIDCFCEFWVMIKFIKIWLFFEICGVIFKFKIVFLKEIL